MKKLKYLLLAVFVSCAFMLSACGGGQLGVEAQANIGNLENYTAAETADLTELEGYVAADAEETNVNKYRMTATISSTAMEAKYNLIFAQTADNYEMAMKADVDSNGQEVTLKLYIKDGWIYADGSISYQGQSMNMKGKEQIPAGTGFEDIDFVASLASLNLEALLEMAQGSLEGSQENVNVKVNAEGTTKRFMIERLNGSQEVESSLIFVFEDGVLNSCTVTLNSYMTMSATIQAFDGEIEYPGFGGYEEMELGLV